MSVSKFTRIFYGILWPYSYITPVLLKLIGNFINSYCCIIYQRGNAD